MSRKYVDGDRFVQWTNQSGVIVIAVLGFAMMAALPHSDNAISEYLIFAVGGILGLTLVFTFFRRFERFFVKDKRLGRSLQYVGTRTLDIYLLHYFVLPRFLILHSDWLQAQDCRALEFVVALLLSLAVVLVCLFVSYVIRLSPFLGRFLFGAK